MNIEQKQLITDALNDKISQSSTSGAAIAEAAGVSKSYVSKIKNGEYSLALDGGKRTTEISDETFYKLAQVLGLQFEFEPHFQNLNYQKIYRACNWAQATKRRVLIDSQESGAGKTYALESYTRQNDLTLYIKATSLMKGRDLIQLLLDKLHIRVEGRRSNVEKLSMITSKLITPGYLIILDEMESVSPDMFRVLKDIEDATYRKCAIVLCGKGLSHEMQASAKRGKKLMPQLWRRFRSNRIMLGYFTRADVTRACEEHEITETSAIRALQEMVGDYAMLNEYIRDIHQHIIAKGFDANGTTVKQLFNEFNTEVNYA